MIAFLYFIQIFTLQEKIQAGINEMGLNLARTAYIYEDFMGAEEAFGFDSTIFGEEYEINLQEMASAALNGAFLKLYAMNFLDVKKIDHSCIKDGYDGVSFRSSNIIESGRYIDVIMRYQVHIPIRLFILKDMNIMQRVRLRGWTGKQIPPTYSMVEEGESADSPIVYITETGSVYHVNRECSHIKLSIVSVIGIPSERRNDNGAKYYPCESCCTENCDPAGIYYITSDGTRYHTISDCSKIKRTVKEVRLSEIPERSPCKRCGN
jgi:hypothetical protein